MNVFLQLQFYIMNCGTLFTTTSYCFAHLYYADATSFIPYFYAVTYSERELERKPESGNRRLEDRDIVHFRPLAFCPMYYWPKLLSCQMKQFCISSKIIARVSALAPGSYISRIVTKSSPGRNLLLKNALTTEYDKMKS